MRYLGRYSHIRQISLIHRNRLILRFNRQVTVKTTKQNQNLKNIINRCCLTWANYLFSHIFLWFRSIISIYHFWMPTLANCMFEIFITKVASSIRNIFFIFSLTVVFKMSGYSTSITNDKLYRNDLRQE